MTTKDTSKAPSEQTPLLRAGARGSAVMLSARMINTLVHAVSLLVLSRLLSPSDFGLVAMVTVLVGIGELIRDFGLVTSALRVPELDNQQASNLFWANAALGVIGACLIVAAAPALAAVNSEPVLRTIAPVMAVTIILNGLQAQFFVHLVRNRQFKRLALTELVPPAVALGIAIHLAATGFGYWAIVFQAITNSLLLLLGRVLASNWFPRLPARARGTRSLLVSGFHYGTASFVDYLSTNIDSFVVGAKWGPQNLGVYNRAFQLLSAPIGQILSPLTNVALPTLNAAKLQGRDVAAMLLKIQPVVGLGITAIFSAAAASAGDLIPIVLGTQWNFVVPVFQILAIGGTARALNHVTNWYFLILGDSRQQLYSRLVGRSLSILLIVPGALISVEGAALGVSVGLIVNWLVNILWLGRTANMQSPAFLRNGCRIMVLGWFATGSTLALFAIFPIENHWIGLTVKSCAAVVILILATAASKVGRTELRMVIKAVKAVF